MLAWRTFIDLGRNLLDVVSELVIGHNESVHLLGVLDAIRVVIVLRRSSHDAIKLEQLV